VVQTRITSEDCAPTLAKNASCVSTRLNGTYPGFPQRVIQLHNIGGHVSTQEYSVHLHLLPSP